MGNKLYKEKIQNYLNHDTNSEELGFDKTKLSYIPEYFSSYLEQERIPNFVCLVSRFGEVAHYSHQGFKNIETKKEIDNETIFRIYSMTKPITSVAIMMLYERGLIRLSMNFIDIYQNLKIQRFGRQEILIIIKLNHLIIQY